MSVPLRWLTDHMWLVERGQSAFLLFPFRFSSIISCFIFFPVLFFFLVCFKRITFSPGVSRGVFPHQSDSS